MRKEQERYDLGAVELDEPPPKIRGVRAAPKLTYVQRERPLPTGVRPGLAGSLSMFVPGLGQMVTGEIAWGTFYLTWMTCCVACLWALVASLDRIAPTLRDLSLPPEVLPMAIVVLLFIAITVHLSAIVHAQASAARWDSRFAAHPIVAGLASLLLPGWGQVLAGHRCRAIAFLSGVWMLAAAWLVVTPPGMRVVFRLGLAVPAGMRDGWGPAAMLAAPAVLWVIAVYDAAAGAAAQRRV